MTLYWIWLTRCKGIGASGIRELLQLFADPEEIYFATARDYARLGLSERVQRALGEKSLEEAKKIVRDCGEKGLSILTYSDPAYPQGLKGISDPPAVLYCKGKLPDTDAFPSVAVVGARKASVYGLSAAKRLSYQIASGGGIVVTGLAGGVDSMAAEGALLAGGLVVGVLGCGADVVYPRNNGELFADVCYSGCILSEYPPGTPPYASNFPQRNRILSGLSDAVLVVEAGEKSGALITARCGLEQGKDVFAVPGMIDNPVSVGSNELLREGAGLVRCGYDVLREYENRYPGRITAVHNEPPEQKAKTPPSPKKEEKPLPQELSPDEQSVLAKLAQGRIQLDELIDSVQLPAPRVLAAMTMLEIKGQITRLPGKWYEIK